MSIKFEKIKAGVILWDVRRNTDMMKNKFSIWPVRIMEVDKEKRRVFASWNSNDPEWMGEEIITKYRAKRPKQEDKW